MRYWLLLILAIFWAHPGAAKAESAAKRPNIVLVVYDTLRYDHVTCNGYARDTTPTFDRIAAEGARFTHMFANSGWTMPSMMSMFTSLPSSLHGAVSYQSQLVDGYRTLPESLREAGYQCAGIISNPTLNRKFGFGKGFDYYDDYSVMLSGSLNLFDDFEGRQNNATTISSPTVTRLALNWLTNTRDAEKPFFLFLLYFDPHSDYMPPPPYDRRYDTGYKGDKDGSRMYSRKREHFTPEEREHIKALYDGEIRYTDEHVGQVVDKLDALGVADNTMVILTSDHGEEFWDHGGILHGHTLYDELVRVPFVVRWPGKVKPGTVLENLASLEDVMPTLCELGRASLPKACQGFSLQPLLTGQGELKRSHVLLESGAVGRQLLSMRTKTMKTVRDLASGGRCSFDLEKDPKELTPHCSAPIWAKNLGAKLDKTMAEIQAAKGEKKPEVPKLDPVLIQRLKSLGYMQ